jgi:hypothetical protein
MAAEAATSAKDRPAEPDLELHAEDDLDRVEAGLEGETKAAADVDEDDVDERQNESLV